jgi:predicted amidohydrolase YtcJ
MSRLPVAEDDASDLLFVDVEVEGRPAQCVRVEQGTVTYAGHPGELPPGRGRRPLVEIDGRGGALLPGLHDHHLHLLAMAAALRSVSCGPPEVTSRSDLERCLRGAAAQVPPGAWVRFVGHDETVVGPLDAPSLDALLGPVSDRPVRVQHRSGHQWALNSSALFLVRRELGDSAVDALGPDAGRGVLTGADAGLRAAWGSDGWPPLEGIGCELARRGVTGVTDATVSTAADEVHALDAAQQSGALPQQVCVLGWAAPEVDGDRLVRGPAKVVLSESALPSLDELADAVLAAGPRGVAVHCVSREALVLAAAALGRAGGGPHRIEHASVAPPEVVSLVAALPVTVVTQPGFVTAHGDRYLAEVDADDRPWLYRLAGWQAAGVPLAGSSDGPFGPLDPWTAMRAAVERRTAAGATLGPSEALTPEAALGLYLGPLEDPAGPRRRVVAGEPADLCLLRTGWTEARASLDAGLVRATYCRGVPAYDG